jgi:hypothetical protein
MESFDAADAISIFEKLSKASIHVVISALISMTVHSSQRNNEVHELYAVLKLKLSSKVLMAYVDISLLYCRIPLMFLLDM